MKIIGLSKIYKTIYEDVSALHNINLVLPDKGLVFIVGVSGSGKTTLMNMLSGVDRPTNGDVIIGKRSLYNIPKKQSKNQMYGYRNSYVGLVFQDYNLIEDLNVYENIKLPYELLGKTDFSRVDEVIKQVDIEDIKYSRVNEISSGQMQRVAIARALIKDSSMILADEPTGNLDSKNEKIVLDLLKEISKDRLVVVITHGAEAAVEYGDRIIEIEDGQIISDTNPITEANDKTPKFIEPKITFSQQALFTKGFIKSNLSRSLSILLVLLLIPLIGGILSTYVFYNVAVGYKKHQQKYNSDYVVISQPVDIFDLYYTPEQIDELKQKYSGSKLTHLYDVNIPVTKSNVEEDSFYKKEINNLLIYNDSFKLEGIEPEYENEIVITDYVRDSIILYQGIEEPEYLMIDGFKYDIVGVIDTDYEDFLTNDYTNNIYLKMAFNENLKVYNSIFTSFLGYLRIMDNLKMFRETVRYTVHNSNTAPQKKYDEVVFRDSTSTSYNLIHGKYSATGGYGLVSSAMLEKLGFTYAQITSNSARAIMYTYTKSKYSIAVRISGVYESDELGFIINTSDMQNYVFKHSYSRVLIQINDKNYNKIVNKENVINESFEYANQMRNNAKDSRIVMAEILIVFILITLIFSNIINSITINTEKKKIGIKYSFGLRKSSVVMPYIMEILLYTVLSFVVTSVLIKWAFPFLMDKLVYTNLYDSMVFDFYYVSWGTIVGWNFAIYAIILVSLGIMIFNIIKKNPIEIIKDL